MSDEDATTTEDEATPDTDAPAGEPDAEGADAGDATREPETAEPTPALTAVDTPDPAREAVWTRAILPFALPFLSAVGLAVWVVNLSRAFLAGGKQGALVIVMIVTVSIIAGAALMSATPRMQKSTQVMLTLGFIVVILSAGLVSLGPSEEAEGSGAGFEPPRGPAVATIAVEALPSNKYDREEYPTQVGINEIDLLGKGGNHTIDFDSTDADVLGFQLVVSAAQTDKSKVRLKAGDYTIYCSTPGHRAAGMEATIRVQEAAAAPETPPAP
jgi:plastocyanin